MQGRRKPFDPDLEEFGRRAEREIAAYLRRCGYKTVRHPDSKYEIDTEAENSDERFWVEVERTTGGRWQSNSFPFPTLHVLERKGERVIAYGGEGKTVFVFCVREDCRACLVAFPASIRPDRLVPIHNHLCDGELAYDVPLLECLPLDLTQPIRSIAWANGERIRRWIASFNTGDYYRNKLDELTEGEPPYGFDIDQWHEMLRIAEEPFAKVMDCKVRRCGPFHEMPDPARAGASRLVCKHCGRFFGYRFSGER